MLKTIYFQISLIIKFASLILALETAKLNIVDDTDFHIKIVQYIWAVILYIISDIVEAYAFKPGK